MIDQIINFKDVKINKRSLFLIVLLVVQVFGFCYYLNFYEENGYLPSPFIYDKSDTFMDLFNSMYWAYDDGRYTDWGSVYPPLNFLILKLLNFICEGSQYGDPFDLREESISVVYGLLLIYALMPIIVLSTESWKQFSIIDRGLIYIIIILSTPMLFALERGNLILLTPILLSLVISNAGLTRAISIALLINIKPYFVVLMFYYIVKRDLGEMITSIVLAGLIFLVTGYALDNNFYLFIFNILAFSQDNGIFSLREVMSMPSSISAIGYALKDANGFAFASSIQSTAFLSMVLLAIDGVKWGAIFFSIITLIKNNYYIRDAEIVFLLAIVISNLGVWVGGYSVIFYLVFIPLVNVLRWKWIYIILLILIAIPLDIIPLVENSLGIQYSYLSGSSVLVDWTLGIGSIIRPTINTLLLFVLTMELYLRKKSLVIHN